MTLAHASIHLVIDDQVRAKATRPSHNAAAALELTTPDGLARVLLLCVCTEDLIRLVQRIRDAVDELLYREGLS